LTTAIVLGASHSHNNLIAWNPNLFGPGAISTDWSSRANRMSSSVIFFHIPPPSLWAFLSTPLKDFRNASSLINSALSSQHSATHLLLDFKAFVVCWPLSFVHLSACHTWLFVAEDKKSCHIFVFDCRIVLRRLLRCFLTCYCVASPLRLALFNDPKIFLFSAISSFHHLFDLAQTFTSLPHLLRWFTKFRCIHSASFCSSSSLLSSFKTALTELLSFQYVLAFS